MYNPVRGIHSIVDLPACYLQCMYTRTYNLHSAFFKGSSPQSDLQKESTDTKTSMHVQGDIGGLLLDKRMWLAICFGITVMSESIRAQSQPIITSCLCWTFALSKRVKELATGGRFTGLAQGIEGPPAVFQRGNALSFADRDW